MSAAPPTSHADAKAKAEAKAEAEAKAKGKAKAKAEAEAKAKAEAKGKGGAPQTLRVEVVLQWLEATQCTTRCCQNTYVLLVGFASNRGWLLTIRCHPTMAL